MEKYINIDNYIEQNLTGEHYNKVFLAKMMSFSLKGIKEISEKIGVDMNLLTIDHIVNALKEDKI